MHSPSNGAETKTAPDAPTPGPGPFGFVNHYVPDDGPAVPETEEEWAAYHRRGKIANARLYELQKDLHREFMQDYPAVAKFCPSKKELTEQDFVDYRKWKAATAAAAAAAAAVDDDD